MPDPRRVNAVTHRGSGTLLRINAVKCRGSPRGGESVLTRKQLIEIEVLQQECESKEPIQLKLNWDMLQTRNERDENDFFHYENGRLGGFLGLYGFGNKVELCGMVAPEFRRKGIFTELLMKAKKVMENRKFSEILLNTPANSQSAKGFFQSVSNKYVFTEHQMKWHETVLMDSNGLEVRPANQSDYEAEIRLDVQCFGFTEDEARNFNQRLKAEKLQQFYMIDFGGETVGKIRVSHINGEAWIFGFSVFPENQGSGIGRKALSKVVMKEYQQGLPIFLEVEAKNARALGLYESCGFRTFQAPDYYRLLSF